MGLQIPLTCLQYIYIFFRQELQNWLQINNKTPSKFRHLLCFEADHEKDPVQDCLRKSTLTVDELSEQVCRVYYQCIY